MTDAEFISKLSTAINVELDLPFIAEGDEQKWIEWIVGKANPYVPAYARDYIVGAADGISDEEAARWEDDLVAELNRQIDLPYAPEFLEEQLIRPVVHAGLQFFKTGNAV